MPSAGRGARIADLARGYPQKFLPFTIRVMAPFVLGLALMPWPVTVELRDGRMAIDEAFAVAVRCADARVAPAAERLMQRILRLTGLPRMGGADVKLTVECAARGSDYPVLGEDESYTLDITAQGATLRAPEGIGVLRGLETFAQAITVGAQGFEVPAVHIQDRPRFPWRGLMIDVSRHWMPVEVIERNLDAMAAVKLNVFHWHLSDDQGFRIESKKFPRLQQYGSDGQFYTQAEVRDVIEYSRNRGIRIVPEFDIPGHATSWLPGYPALASGKGPYEIMHSHSPLAALLDPTKESTYKFLDGLIGEMTKLFPDEYFHIGGGAGKPRGWRANPSNPKLLKERPPPRGQGRPAYFYPPS